LRKALLSFCLLLGELLLILKILLEEAAEFPILCSGIQEAACDFLNVPEAGNDA
jgi:hypothetical protein